MSPLYSIRPEAVAVIDAADKPAILDRLSKTFAESWGLDAALVHEQLEERERLGSTGFGRGVTHLHALAAISRLMRDERVHEALSEAPDAEALYGLLTNAADRHAA